MTSETIRLTVLFNYWYELYKALQNKVNDFLIIVVEVKMERYWLTTNYIITFLNISRIYAT